MYWKYEPNHRPYNDDWLIVTVLDDSGDNEFTYCTIARLTDDGWQTTDYDEEIHDYEYLCGTVTHWAKLPNPAW